MKSKKPSKSRKYNNAKGLRAKSLKFLFILIFGGIGTVLILITHAAPVPPTLSVHIYCSGGYPMAQLSWNDTGQNYVVDMDDSSGSTATWDWYYNKPVGRATSTVAPTGFKLTDGKSYYGDYPYGALTNGAAYWFRLWDGYTESPSYGGVRVVAPNCQQQPPPSPPPSPSPSPTPPPSPSPQPSPPSSTTSSSSGSTSSNPTTQSSNVPSTNSPAQNVDVSPPTPPTNFQALTGDGKTYVELSWEAATDNVGVSGYELQRSTDQQNWTTLQAQYPETSYTDTNTLFNTHYYYRIRAIDANNNYSGYATADTATANFGGNIAKDQDSLIHSDDNAITVKILAGALLEDAQCNVAPDDSVLSPNIKNAKTVSGPYQIICKNSAGSLITQFTKPLQVQWKILPQKNIGKIQYFSYNNNWQSVALSAHDSKKHLDSFELTNATTFVAMGQVKHTSPLVKVFEILSGFVLTAFAVIFVMYRRYKKRQRAAFSDYWSKITGG